MQPDGHDTHIDFGTLNDFADGDLAERAAAAVRAHLRGCAACREEVRFIRSSGETIRYLPTPKPPDELFDDLFRGEPGPATVLPLRGPRGEVAVRSRPLWFSSIAVGVLALIGTVVMLTVGSGRAMAGSSMLTLERTGEGALSLRYTTVSPLAEEPSLRARIRYWVPDSLRYVQTEPGFGTVELSRAEVGRFEGIVDLPPDAAYAIVAIEDNEGTRVDSGLGRAWEYLETDSKGRPTLQARRYQLVATNQFNIASTASVAEQAVSEFPEQPEMWVWHFAFSPERVSGEALDGLLPAHEARLVELDRAAREGDPGPLEMDALFRYARNVERMDVGQYWSDRLVSRYPGHGLAAMADLGSIVGSPGTNDEKMKALEESWVRSSAPVTAQVGLRLSYEFADPALTETWLARHAATSVFRNLDYDVRVAGAMMEVPEVRPVAERWILDRLSASWDWVGRERPLHQSRANFEAEVRRGRALLYLYLSRIRLARGDLRGASEAAEQSAAESWDPRVFVEAAGIQRAAGSDARASQLIAFARVDPVTPLEPYLAAGDDSNWPEPSEIQLAEARVALFERTALELLDEHIDLGARFRSEAGDETTLRDVSGADGVTLVLWAFEPDEIPEDVFALLETNADQLSSAGVRTLAIAQRPDSQREPGRDPGLRFHHDRTLEVLDALGGSGIPQYFVLDPHGRLRQRGEDVEAAIRAALVLSM